MLLTLATSRQDLERLHGLLQDNARLPNKQLAALGDHWQEWYEPARIGNGSSRINDTLTQELLRSLTPELGLAWWYVELFHEGRNEAQWMSWESRGVREQIHQPDGYVYFRASMLGVSFSTGFFRINQKTIGVHFHLPGAKLTEPLLHKLRQLNPVPCKDIGAHDPCLNYEFAIDGIRKFIKEDREINPLIPNKGTLVTKPKFLVFMAEKLRELGVPVEYLVPGERRLRMI